MTPLVPTFKKGFQLMLNTGLSKLSENANTQSNGSILLEQPSTKDLKHSTRKSIMQIVQNKR